MIVLTRCLNVDHKKATYYLDVGEITANTNSS